MVFAFPLRHSLETPNNRYAFNQSSSLIAVCLRISFINPDLPAMVGLGTVNLNLPLFMYACRPPA